MSPEDRFWVKVDKTEACWVWTAYRFPTGYGQFRLDGKRRRAHRVSWEWANGPIPNGMEIDHLCWNPACVNPSHMRIATRSMNNQNLSGAYTNSKSGVRGVSWNKSRRTWEAKAAVNGKSYHIGYFATQGEADTAVTKWRKQNMPHSTKDKASNRGLFSREKVGGHK